MRVPRRIVSRRRRRWNHQSVEITGDAKLNWFFFWPTAILGKSFHLVMVTFDYLMDSYMYSLHMYNVKVLLSERKTTLIRYLIENFWHTFWANWLNNYTYINKKNKKLKYNLPNNHLQYIRNKLKKSKSLTKLHLWGCKSTTYARPCFQPHGPCYCNEEVIHNKTFECNRTRFLGTKLKRYLHRNSSL